MPLSATLPLPPLASMLVAPLCSGLIKHNAWLKIVQAPTHLPPTCRARALPSLKPKNKARALPVWSAAQLTSHPAWRSRWLRQYFLIRNEFKRRWSVRRGGGCGTRRRSGYLCAGSVLKKKGAEPPLLIYLFLFHSPLQLCILTACLQAHLPGLSQSCHFSLVLLCFWDVLLVVRLCGWKKLLFESHGIDPALEIKIKAEK